MGARFHGLIKLLGASAALALVMAIALSHGINEAGQQGPLRWAALSVLGALGVAGLIELLFGTRLDDLFTRLGELHGWQRGVGGALAALLAIGLLQAGTGFLR